jgi:hypothetical protein
MIVATVRVDNDDLAQAIARDLAAGVVEQAQDEVGFDGDGSGVVARFQDLREYEIREDDRRFNFRRAAADLAGNLHIGGEWQMVSMPLDAGQRKQTNSLNLCCHLRELIACEFFPTHKSSLLWGL